ncbi:unnamed protein product, partial [Adineta steineri]
QWISSLFLSNATSHHILDFRTFTFAQFQALALLCHTANQSIFDAYPEFTEITSVLIDNLQNNILANENRTARIVLMSLAQNRLISALRTNVYLRSVYGSKLFIANPRLYLEKNGTSWSKCMCPLTGDQCVHPVGAFYSWSAPEFGEPPKPDPPPRFQIPGLMTGCLPLESIRQSTLECLYQQSCINILSSQSNISPPKALKKTLSSFPLNTTIGDIFDKSLFVEYWFNKSSFEDYFTACAPGSLTYSYEGRSRFLAILTVCISAFGGLVIAWDLITPAIVKIWSFIKWKKQNKHLPKSSDETTIEMVALQPINEAVTAHVHRTIYTFNLFPPDNENDLEEQHVGIIATRLYILFLFCGILVLAFYTSLTVRTQTITITSPSLEQFETLESRYSTLVCLCSRFSMSYNRIMSVSPIYHQICSSELLQESWLLYFELKEIQINTTLFLVTDFRYGGRSFFDLTRVLCKTAHETVENAIHLFRSRRLVTTHTLSRRTFDRRVQTRLNQFKQQTITSFVNLLELIRSSIQTNLLVTDLLTTTGFSYLTNKQTLKVSPRFYSRNLGSNSCSCAISSRCTIPQGFYLQADNSSAETNVTIPGLVLGCYTIDSVLQSTLECFFEQTCLQYLINMRSYDVIGMFHPLDNRVTQVQPLRKETSRFLSNTTLESIVLQLFVEDWRISKDFKAYYERCAPKECTYTVIRRFHTAFMIATMLGFYSGLSAILEIILPPSVRFIKQKWKKQRKNTNTPQTTDNTDQQSSTKIKHSYSFKGVYKSIYSCNLFCTQISDTDEKMKRQEIIATRIYLILLLLCIIAALLYAGPFSEETTTTVIELPTANDFNDLYSKNISTLTCPCSTAAVPHSKFLSIIPEYHSICSSDYIEPSYWIDLSKKGDKVSTLLSAHYRILASLCQTANRTIKSAQNIFSAQELVTVEPMTYTSFMIQTEALIATFISQIPSDYRRTLNFIIRSFGVNHLFNVFTSNWKLDFTDEDQQHIISTYPRQFISSNCTCATSSDCTDPVTEDIVNGCFPFDGFRLSKFENLSLGQLNDYLFVMTWKNQRNYTAYFDTCHPLECQYILPDKNNPSDMFLTLLGLYGGLICILRLIVGESLHVHRWWLKISQQPQAESSAMDPVIL